jgi:hypothetical protein
LDTTWRNNPLIYEINTWPWLHALGQSYGRAITLGTVPDADLDALASWGFDAVWLMGVWERSPAGRAIAQEHPGLQAEYHRALPDFVPEDVAGSPYAIHRYEVDPHLGGRDELADLRGRLAARGLRLVLDFVPNHVAVDHPWLATHPECFIQGTSDDMDRQPDHFFLGPVAGHGQVFANGRDPYFPAWTDTAQLNAFSPVLREKAVETLLDIAAQCDGIRCDMAMLVTNQVFAQTWGERAGPPPAPDFWPVVIPAVKGRHPNTLFVAEVYWDMEWALQQQGFDYTYDKRLYDRLKNDPARAITIHLGADRGYQQHMLRFIENHDEARAEQALGPGRHLAAAALVATLPGGTLLHEGQLHGARIRLPVQLGRRGVEKSDPVIEAFYRTLLDEAAHPVYHDGEWALRETSPAWDLNATHNNLIAFTWRLEDERRLVVVNYAAASSQGRIALPEFGLAGRDWRLRDVMTGAQYERAGGDMVEFGLYVDLQPWQVHIFEIS